MTLQPTAVVFGVLMRNAREEWGGRNQLLLSLKRHAPVILLEQRPEGTRNPLPSIEKVADNLYIVRTAFALRTSRIGRRFHRLPTALDGWWFRRALGSIGITRHVLWLTVVDPALARGVAAERVIYDCMDPNFLPENQVEFDAVEDSIARRAALTLSTAHVLHTKMQRLNRRSFLLPNATSRDFHPRQTKALPRPDLLADRQRPIIGYLGTIDWRFDPDMVLSAARAFPNCTFAIVGRINHDQGIAVSELRSLPNVIMPGQVSYEDGRAWVAAFDVGLIPFRLGAMNDAINPVKMYMYLMAGLPVVASAIEECRQNAFVLTGPTPEEFTRLLKSSLMHLPAPDRKQRISFALRNTWDQRADEAIKLLRDNGLLPE